MNYRENCRDSNYNCEDNTLPLLLMAAVCGVFMTSDFQFIRIINETRRILWKIL